MDFATMNIWCWIIPLLVGVLCGIFGYIWGKGSVNTSRLTDELERLEEDNTRLQTELNRCREERAATPPAVEQELPFDPDAARAVFGKRIVENDLKIVEGIGPKIEGLFHNYDIKTWHALADTTVAKCHEVLDSGGDRFKIHDPASWPMQARMAYEGKWKELLRWQDEHNHGKL